MRGRFAFGLNKLCAVIQQTWLRNISVAE